MHGRVTLGKEEIISHDQVTITSSTDVTCDPLATYLTDTTDSDMGRDDHSRTDCARSHQGQQTQEW